MVLSVYIVKDPSVHISASKTNIDAGQSITFSAGVSNGTAPFTYSWTVNGGSSVSTASSFTYQFASSGTYSMEVSIKDADGFTAVSSLNITVNSDPSVSAKATYTQIDTGATETFSLTASGGSGGYLYRWMLNGNTISTSASFTYVFNSVGSMTVEAVVTDSNGYSVYQNMTVDVVPQPSTSFTVEYSQIDTGIQDLFNASVQYGTAPYNYTWSIGNRTIGYGSSLNYVFTIPGTYYVNLTVRDYFGYKASASHMVIVAGHPVPKITANRTAIDAGQSISFLSGIAGGISPYNYTWYVNGAVAGYGTSMTYKFSANGTYEIELVVKDSFGISGTAYMNITVNPPLTVKTAESHSAIDTGQSDYFSSSVSGGTGPYTYEWKIDGSVFSSSQNFTYNFDQYGTYNITLIVTDSVGEATQYTMTVTVNPSLSAYINVSHSIVDINIGDTISLTAHNGTLPYTYAILINGVKVSSSDAYSLYFTANGTYYITAFANDSAGESESLSSTITVRKNPSVNIVTPTNKTDANVPVQFRGILSGGTGPYTYSWLIAGHTYTNATLSHAFSSPGEYEIQLTVTDAFGRQAISSMNETIYPDPSATLIAPSYITASTEEPLSLNISGSIPPYKIQWYFPSGEQFSGNNITHAFSSAGPETFEVKLTDSTGYTDVQNFTVNVHLYVSIAANTTRGLGPLSVQFSSSVLGGSDYSFNWTFSQGHYSLEQNPLYTFPSGNYTVHFEVISANGAKGYANITIYSLPPPVSISYSSNKNITQYFYFNATPNWDATSPSNMTWSSLMARILMEWI